MVLNWRIFGAEKEWPFNVEPMCWTEGDPFNRFNRSKIWAQKWEKNCSLTRERNFVHFWHFREDSFYLVQTLPKYGERYAEHIPKLTLNLTVTLNLTLNQTLSLTLNLILNLTLNLTLNLNLTRSVDRICNHNHDLHLSPKHNLNLNCKKKLRFKSLNFWGLHNCCDFCSEIYPENFGKVWEWVPMKSINLPRVTIWAEHHTQKGHSFLTGVLLVLDERGRGWTN